MTCGKEEAATMSSGPADSERQVEELARALDRMAEAIDHARAIGLAVEVPDALYRACLAIVSRYRAPSHSTDPDQRRRTAHSSASVATTGSRPSRPLPTDVPLRRLVWQVLDPGEEFTVTDVVGRLNLLNVSAHPNKVSNVLGYWVSRGRLARRRKGVYVFPIVTDTGVQAGRSGNGLYGAVGQETRLPRKDEDYKDGQSAQRKAM